MGGRAGGRAGGWGVCGMEQGWVACAPIPFQPYIICSSKLLGRHPRHKPQGAGTQNAPSCRPPEGRKGGPLVGVGLPLCLAAPPVCAQQSTVVHRVRASGATLHVPRVAPGRGVLPLLPPTARSALPCSLRRSRARTHTQRKQKQSSQSARVAAPTRLLRSAFFFRLRW